jgi:hypothetical protein
MAPPHTIMLALSYFLCTAIASSLFSIYLKLRKPPEGHNMLYFMGNRIFESHFCVNEESKA